MKTKTRILKWIFASASLGLSLGCAPGNGTSAITQYSQCPNNACPKNSINTLPAAISNALLGSYTAQLTSTSSFTQSSGGSQAATIVLNAATVASDSRTFANITVTSNGSAFAGPIQFSSMADMVLQGYQVQGTNGMEAAYGFTTAAQVINNLSTEGGALSLEFVVVLNSANQFDPALSSIYIMDDGFSQGVAGGQTYPFAAFSSLAKH